MKEAALICKRNSLDINDILVVDDTPNNLRLLSQTLVRAGYKVRCAVNGKMAFITIKAKLPDLILLDINMPDMDGLEICRRLKQSELTKDIPVIFVSALDEVFDKVEALR